MADETPDNLIERTAIAMCELGQVEWDVQEDHRQEYFRQLARAAIGVLGERPVVTELAPDLTLTDRGRTTGPHIGIPLAHVEAILRMEDGARGGDVDDFRHLTDEDKDRVHETFKEMREFVAAEGKPS